MNFQIGDVVYLKSGGPAMTVNQIYQKMGTTHCVWFVQNEQKEFIFNQDTLTKDNPQVKPAVAVVATKHNF